MRECIWLQQRIVHTLTIVCTFWQQSEGSGQMSCVANLLVFCPMLKKFKHRLKFDVDQANFQMHSFPSQHVVVTMRWIQLWCAAIVCVVYPSLDLSDNEEETKSRVIEKQDESWNPRGSSEHQVPCYTSYLTSTTRSV